jgi:general secretion pathway protein G
MLKARGALGGRKYKAFTLIELLIVIVIIGILAGFVMFTVRSATLRARNARAKDSIRSVQTALETWLVDSSDSDLTKLDSSGSFIPVTPSLIKDVSGVPLLNSTPLDGQGKRVNLKVIDANTYQIEARSGVDAARCWWAKPAANNLNEDPVTCPTDMVN